MSNWWQHAIFSTAMAFLYMLLIAWLSVPELGPLDIVALFLYDLPDSDLRKTGSPLVAESTKHRHWFWHSSIIPVLVFLLGLWKGNLAGMGTFCVVIGSHLLADIKIRGKKRGTYLIYVCKGDRLSARQTDQYLLGNGILCFVVAGITLFL